MTRRTTTIVAADIVGYSRLMAQDEAGAIERLKAARIRHIDPVIGQWQGRVFKTMGDGLLVEFPNPRAAVLAAFQLQSAMVAENNLLPPEARMLFRIGINLGEVVEDGGDLLGDVINVAARLESIAPPGGICVSRPVRDAATGEEGLRLTELGPQYVKNIPHAIDAWRIEVPGVIAATIAENERASRLSVAVLPFDLRADAATNAILGDAVADDITAQLARFRALTVIARRSAFIFRGSSLPLAEIGQQLGARYLVTGSLQTAGDRLRLGVQLIEAESGYQIWTGRWDGLSHDIFALQDEVTAAVVGSLAPELGAHERRIAGHVGTDNLTAWQLCHQGIEAFFRYSIDSYPQAIAFFEQAIAADPGFALPQAHLARLHSVLVYTGHSKNPFDDIMKGMAHARAAIEIDPRLEEGHIALAALLIPTGQEAEARKALTQAMALNDNNAGAYQIQTFINLFQPVPDPDEMEAAALMALRLSPTEPRAWAFYWAASCARWIRDGRMDENVLGYLEPACRMPQVEYFTLLAAAVMYVRIGRREDAKAMLDKARAKRPGLTLREHVESFRFPYWPTLKKTIDRDYAALVEMGLPPG